MRSPLSHKDQPEDAGARGRKRRRPAFFLQALLSEDIPPFLTDQSGEKLSLRDDPLAEEYQNRLDTDPASL